MFTIPEIDYTAKCLRCILKMFFNTTNTLNKKEMDLD